MASIAKRPDGQWRARYRDGAGKEHARHFRRRTDAQQWLDQEITKQQTGSWIAPRAAKITVEEWCKSWLDGYRTRKSSTVRMAEVHIAKIVVAFGPRRLDSLRPSDIKSWLVRLQTDHAPSYIYASHSRLAQVLADAVHDGVLARNPCSRRTAPRTGSQRPYVATTSQIWDLHDAMGERYGAGLLLASFAGLRLAEVCGLRVSDVDFMRGVVSPVQQYPADPLKTEMSRTPIPIPSSLALTLAAHVAEFPSTWVMCDSPASRWGHGSYSESSGRPAQRWRICRTVSDSTICGITTPIADQQGTGREGGAGEIAACIGQDDLGHLWPPVAGFR